MSNNHQNQRLLNQIADLEARLAGIDAVRAEVVGQLDALRAELARRSHSHGSADFPLVLDTSSPESPAGKIALFRSLFRGRLDVFPKLWRNVKKQREGYAPACANEWVPDVCEKPRVRCGECPNQAFIPVTDAVIRDHLQGRHVVGVYPMLSDETSWFLAVDLDGTGWKEDVAAFTETCSTFGLHPAVERSRSGNGAHIWFFFAEPIRAGAIRKMGCCLITETMTRRHELPMSSYDRLFPNQDTMPKGGFGNLIALPLQRKARQRGNTMFVDLDSSTHLTNMSISEMASNLPFAIEPKAQISDTPPQELSEPITCSFS